jgi:hypothetical protein
VQDHFATLSANHEQMLVLKEDIKRERDDARARLQALQKSLQANTEKDELARVQAHLEQGCGCVWACLGAC